ncbi:MAG: peptidylprolyl isomerase [Bacteroidales bacterium]|nr:peptidylprolyl isomerase [Bacteroidales bacterium]
MKHFCLFLISLVFFSVALAQDKAPVLMTVKGHNVFLSDFVAAYRKNMPNADFSKESIHLYLELYKDYCIKLQEARKSGVIPSFSAVPSNNALSDNDVSSLSEREMKNWRKQAGGKGRLLVDHIFLPLPQHASISVQSQLRSRIDSAYRVVQSGADFHAVAQKILPGRNTIHWVCENEQLAEVERTFYAMSIGGMCSPFLATDGYHLAKLLDKETLSDEGKVRQNVSSNITSGSVHQNTQIPFSFSLKDEYNEGVLLNQLYENQLEGKAEKEKMGLFNYFQANIKKYEWSVPHYKGILMMCSDKKVLKAAMKYLKGKSAVECKAILATSKFSQMFPGIKHDGVKLYSLSQNPFVDELAFNGPKQTRPVDTPYIGVVGKVLKKYPESVDDVHAQVVSDYQQHLEEQWMDNLRKQYPIVVNEKVLKSIIRK